MQHVITQKQIDGFKEKAAAHNNRNGWTLGSQMMDAVVQILRQHIPAESPFYIDDTKWGDTCFEIPLWRTYSGSMYGDYRCDTVDYFRFYWKVDEADDVNLRQLDEDFDDFVYTLKNRWLGEGR